MQTTANYGLKKPEGTDVVNIQDFNDNSDIIDTQLKSLNDNKADKISGKGLSTNDYTTTDKNKLAGIEAGAQVNDVTSVAGKTGAVTLTGTDIPAATTAAQGTVQLSTATNSTSTALAATPSAVKAAMDKAVTVETSLTSHLADYAQFKKDQEILYWMGAM